jgi:hypothetical protein
MRPRSSKSFNDLLNNGPIENAVMRSKLGRLRGFQGMGRGQLCDIDEKSLLEGDLVVSTITPVGSMMPGIEIDAQHDRRIAGLMASHLGHPWRFPNTGLGIVQPSRRKQRGVGSWAQLL